MPKDPIIEEIREIRRKIDAEFGDDWEGYVKHLLEVEERYKDRLIDLPSRQSEQPKKAG